MLCRVNELVALREMVPYQNFYIMQDHKIHSYLELKGKPSAH